MSSPLDTTEPYIYMGRYIVSSKSRPAGPLAIFRVRKQHIGSFKRVQVSNSRLGQPGLGSIKREETDAYIETRPRVSSEGCKSNT